MILDDPTAMLVLKAVYLAASGPAGPIIRREEVAQLTSIDPAAIHDAIDALLDARLLLLGATDDRICLSRAGSACAQGFSQRQSEQVA